MAPARPMLARYSATHLARWVLLGLIVATSGAQLAAASQTPDRITGGVRTYEVRPGDSWRSIGSRVGVDPSVLATANGLTVDESSDGGTNWDNVYSASIVASTAYKDYVKVSAPEIRVRYANSANNTTTFRYSILGETEERGNG